MRPVIRIRAARAIASHKPSVVVSRTILAAVACDGWGGDVGADLLGLGPEVVDAAFGDVVDSTCLSVR